jgi:hypothetical protein
MMLPLAATALAQEEGGEKGAEGGGWMRGMVRRHLSIYAQISQV